MRRVSVPEGRAPFAVPADDHDDELRAELAALKAVVYRPDPPAEAVARMAELRVALEDDAAPQADEPPRVPHRRRHGPRLPTAAPVAALVCAAVCAALIVRSTGAPAPAAAPSEGQAPRGPVPALHDERAAVQQVVLDHPDELSAADWFTMHPEDLPRPWTTARPATSRSGLVGPRTIALALRPETTRLLVFVLCSTEDMPFRWALQVSGHPGAQGGGGAGCRDVTGSAVDVPSGSGDVRLRVSITPGVHYAVTVYEH